MSIITLTTDFGTRDWFVGTMKGIILGIQPRAQVIDITHEIASGDIRSAAFALMTAASCFPKKDTIHIAIVDPGVGSKRKAIAAQTDKATFIGPDNGVLSWALRGRKIRSLREITNNSLFRHPVSRTFHGRDIFSPVAAHLVSGVSFSQVGPQITDWIQLPWPEPEHTGKAIEGEILYLDHFGNGITNLPHDLLSEGTWSKVSIRVKNRHLGTPESSYSATKKGALLAILSSSGFLEVAVNGGSAQKRLRLKVGDKVLITTSQAS